MLTGVQPNQSQFSGSKASYAIDAEISLLSKLSLQVPAETALGDSNLEALQVQIEVLSSRLSLEEVEARYNSHLVDPYTLLCARFACEWLYEDVLSPSEDWLTMLYPDATSKWVN